ncbi:hypothetical protein KVT40_006099 [Elsinoe batatas]|uniref:Uncharacterized protein n=1 Tax=Elsinoe batatas TaxID=2601811 RepID=A0A8K0KZZ7_9PEZI|nr:hypothetical protein KVT40_006099 [Elsinoe batatas]
MPCSGFDAILCYPFSVMVKDKRFGSKKQPCNPNFNPCCYCIMNDVYNCSIPLDRINNEEEKQSEDYEWGCSCCANANRKCYQVPISMNKMVVEAIQFLIEKQPSDWDFQHDRMTPIKSELKRILPRGYENGRAGVHKGCIAVKWPQDDSPEEQTTPGMSRKRSRTNSESDAIEQKIKVKRERSPSAEESVDELETDIDDGMAVNEEGVASDEEHENSEVQNAAREDQNEAGGDDDDDVNESSDTQVEVKKESGTTARKESARHATGHRMFVPVVISDSEDDLLEGDEGWVPPPPILRT